MKRIVFVHDLQEDPKIRISYLESRGYVVEPCRSGEFAMKRLDTGMPSIVLIDVLLEGANGFQVCKTIRERFPASELPIVLFSGIYRSRIYKDAARDAGAQLYLVRPFALDQMVDQIETLLFEQNVKLNLDAAMPSDV